MRWTTKESRDTMSKREVDDVRVANQTRTLISAELFGSPNAMVAANDLSPSSQGDVFESNGAMQHISPYLGCEGDLLPPYFAVRHFFLRRESRVVSQLRRKTNSFRKGSFL